jgi:hypothetical protein
MNNPRKISTTALAKKLALEKRELDSLLQEQGLIVRGDDGWELAPAGIEQGGEYTESPKYGRYIVWPEDLQPESVSSESSAGLVTATTIGKHFEVSRNKINPILAELGWIKKGIKGWMLTDQGKRVGGMQKEHPKTGIPYAIWAGEILQNTALIRTIKELQGNDAPPAPETTEKQEAPGFREKFPATHRCADGHYVRSKAEMLIDNWLYVAEVIHAYERKLPVEEDVYCDFYLPTGRIYIEYWGYEDDPKYQKRKEAKQQIYAKYGFNLIELADKEVQNLDDILPRLLLKHGIQTY